MPFISSPPAYPASPSDPPTPSPKRKRTADVTRPPLRDVASNGANRPINAFMEEEDSDDDAEEALKEQTSSVKRTKPDEEERVDSTQEEASDVTTAKAKEDSQNLSAPTQADQTSQTPALGVSMFARRPVSVPASGPIDSPSSTPTLGTSHRTSNTSIPIRTSSGEIFTTKKQAAQQSLSYERTIAARSETVAGKAQRSYYGIDIHSLINEAKAEVEIETAQASTRLPEPLPSVERPAADQRQKRTLMWTEKYRARKFTELVGDDRTHRSVMHWLKWWDEIVFPGSVKPKSKKKGEAQVEERAHRKILLLTGPPGLGKTTLAHVCARQAGYEVQEINASDERSSNVVKGRIRDMAGTENVKNGIDSKSATGKVSRSARPVCVIVDEVDGVVGGNSSGGGEGGFIKALIDLVNLDQRNSNKIPSQQGIKKKKGDNFRLLRPLILICNDVYHPSLRPLRQSTIAEIIHVRKPPVSMVVTRMQAIFTKENIPFDTDGVRRLCEAAWGITSKKEGGAGSSSTSEGDIRGILVVGEWIATKLRALTDPIANSTQRLTRRWVEQNVLASLAHGGDSSRGIGRGGPKDLVERIFQEGAGFAKAALTAANPTAVTSVTGVKGVAEAQKRATIARLAEMINTSDSSDRIMTDCFTAYASHAYQDDTILSKPDQAYEWLHFHDSLSSQVFGSNEWELAPYLSSPILAFHTLFATPTQSRFSMGGNWDKEGNGEGEELSLPFSGPQASYQAHEAQKVKLALLEALRNSLSVPLMRTYASPSELAVEFIPYLTRLLAPIVTPVLVGGSGTEKSTASVRKASEKALVARAVNAMLASGVRFERSRIEFDDFSSKGQQNGGWVYRMEPALDEATSFPTLTGSKTAKESVRFAVRQVIDQEFSREERRLAEETRKHRGGDFSVTSSAVFSSVAAYNTAPSASALALAGGREKKIKRDFFGRVVAELTAEEEAEEVAKDREGGEARRKRRKLQEEAAGAGDEGRIWITFHEGFSNAVRKPVSLGELMRGL